MIAHLNVKPWAFACLMLVASRLETSSFVVAFCPHQQQLVPSGTGHRVHVREAFGEALSRSTLPSAKRRDKPTLQRTKSGIGMGFSFTFPKFGIQKNRQANALSQELLSLLSDKSREISDEEVMDKIERLEAAGVTSNEDYLYDGPWRVLWKTNTVWQRLSGPFDSVTDNRAYQWYRKDGSAAGIVQALGDKVYVSAALECTPVSKSKELPYAVNVEVLRAYVHAFGWKVPLDFIKGKGTAFVVYIDPKLRIFRSGTGAVAVQTKAEENVFS